jgi:hypothetical protein
MDTGEVPHSRKHIMLAHVCSIPLLPITVAAKGAPTFYSPGVTWLADSKLFSSALLYQAGTSHTQALTKLTFNCISTILHTRSAAAMRGNPPASCPSGKGAPHMRDTCQSMAKPQTCMQYIFVFDAKTMLKEYRLRSEHHKNGNGHTQQICKYVKDATPACISSAQRGKCISVIADFEINHMQGWGWPVRLYPT